MIVFYKKLKIFTLLMLLLAGLLTTEVFSADKFLELNKKGVKLGKSGDYKKALDELNKGLKVYDSRSARVLHNQGWVLEMGGKYKEAIEKYKQAVKRSPDLIHSHERLGYSYYKIGQYGTAIATGEFILKKDPKNQEVKKWIYDAYRMEQAAQAKKKLEDEKEKNVKKIKEVKNKKKKDYKFFASLDYTWVAGYYFEGKNTWDRYISTDGIIINAPYTFKAVYKPNNWIDINIEAGNPYLGASMPHVINQYEKVECLFDLNFLFIGAGALVNHYKDDIIHGDTKRLNDFKPGLIVGFRGESDEFIFSAYPRLYPRDTSSSTGHTLDADYFELSYSYLFDENLRYFSRLSMADYYFTDNDQDKSSFWGYYEVSIGMRLGEAGLTTGKGFGVTIEMAKRVYLELLDSTRPYEKLNGQGYLGYNKDPEGDEDTWSFKSISSVLRIMVEESINEKVFAYQKLTMEFPDRHGDHDEYALQLGAGIRL